MNPVIWFEIAVKDLERARKFYENVLNVKFDYLEMPESKMYMFKGGPDQPGAAGALVLDKNAKPSNDGVVVYFGTEEVTAEVERSVANGGSIVFPKMSIGEYGHIAHVMDTEGNRIGLHSMK